MYKPLAKVYKTLSEIDMTSSRVIKPLSQLDKALSKVYKASAKVFMTLSRLYEASSKVNKAYFKIIKKAVSNVKQPFNYLFFIQHSKFSEMFFELLNFGTYNCAAIRLCRIFIVISLMILFGCPEFVEFR